MPGLAAPSPRLQRMILLVAFGATGSLRLLRDVLYPHHIGIDGRIYTDASRVWLAGGDPWTTAYEFGIRYGAPPPSLLVTAPLTILPSVAAGLVVVVVSAVLAVAAIRSLGLPGWWILWAPILDGVLVGSLDIATMALLVLAAGRAAAFAPMLKVYAVLPMLGDRRWRQLALTGALFVATIPFLPWATFIADVPIVSATLSQQAMTTSVWGNPLLWIGFAIGLASLGAHRAGYLAVPVLWPSTQPHYGAITLPVAMLSTILAVGFAFAFLVPWAPAFSVLLYVAHEAWRRRPATRD
jgi:hypothetical protein